MDILTGSRMKKVIILLSLRLNCLRLWKHWDVLNGEGPGFQSIWKPISHGIDISNWRCFTWSGVMTAASDKRAEAYSGKIGGCWGIRKGWNILLARVVLDGIDMLQRMSFLFLEMLKQKPGNATK